jgi:glycosyltransferase involved in cell wall biosynthesis
MKVLIIQPWIRLGGAELASVHLASELQRRGHKVAIACSFLDLEGMPPEAHAIEYLLPHRLLSARCRRSRLVFLMLAPWILLALTWKHSRGVDVLNPHNFPASWVAVIVGTLRGIPIVWACNGPPARVAWPDATKVGLGDFLGWRLASSWIDKLLVRHMDSVYVPSEVTRFQVRARYGSDPEVVRLGIDGFYREQGPHKSLAKKLGLEGKYVLLAVGKLHPQKNQRVCIEALKQVLPSIPDAVLVLAGGGPMRKEWASEAIHLGVAGHVRFLGNRTASDVRELYTVCDLNLFPPTNQSWGLTPFEALCAGKVSIVSNDSGAAEVLAEQGIGIVCDPTPEAFAQRILEVHRYRGRYRAMARKGRRYVTKNLSWSQYAERVLGLMEEACSPAGDPLRQTVHGVTAR